MIKDKVPGGLAKNMSLEDISKYHNPNNRIDPNIYLKFLKNQLNQGIKIELEHTTDKDIAEEIAKDHLYEDPKYYIKLKTIEENMVIDGAPTPATVKKYKKYNGLKKYARIIKEIVDDSCQKLNITSPKINFIADNNYTNKHNSFGGYNPSTQQIYVVVLNRNIMDVMRSLLHEIIHHKQNIEGRLTESSGEDGNEHENEANAEAGRLMREIGRKYPNLFEVQL
jgi:hypothetical protein